MIRRTSKSCKLKHSSRGGLASNRTRRSFSSCVISLTTFLTDLGSTFPRLVCTHRESGSDHQQRNTKQEKVGRGTAIRSDIRTERGETTYCLSFGRLVVIASLGWIGSYSSLIVAECQSFRVEFERVQG